MCGIAGIISSRVLSESDRTLVRQMTECLRHRGPDGEGEFNSTHLALGMRRLSIIDLKGGLQPLYNEDRSLVLICNGEIYNFIELQHKLLQQGHHFQTGSDCETILHLYEEYGVGCLHHLRGMFAFALWDTRNELLMLARDRIGEKPLYIWRDDRTLIFTSEMKALLKGLPFSPRLNPTSVDIYFHYGYVVEPETILCDINKLPAGHYCIATANPWRVENQRYWDMIDAPPLEGDPVVAIRAELETISTLVIRSDVPVGIALSGGLDSSAVAALAVQKYPDTMHAFSVGYRGHPIVDERNDAKQFADSLKLPFHEIELSTSDMVRAFPDIIYFTDDPIADISGYGYYMVNQIARENGVPVLMQGQGGDELFWGYPWVQRALFDTVMKQKLMGAESSTLKYLSAAISTLYASLPKTPSLNDWRRWRKSIILGDEGIKRWRRWKDGSPNRFVFYDDWMDFGIAKEWKKRMYTNRFASQLSQDGPYKDFTFSLPWNDVPNEITKLITRTYLLENGIAQGDRLSMASSVELRLPLIDYRLVEIVVGHRKVTSDITLSPKAWFKQALKGFIPDWVLNRPKRGFNPPTSEWFNALLKTYGNLMQDGYLVQNQILNPETGQKLANGEGMREGSTLMPFKVLCLELWCRRFLACEYIKPVEFSF